MGFFSKLRQGLEKTKHSLISNIETVVRGYAKIDEEMYDDLEAVMLTGDIGVETTEYLLGKIREGVRSKEIRDGKDVVPYLEKAIVALLAENEAPLPDTTGTTNVIFIVGVNGVGKTTTIGKLASYYMQQGKSVMVAAGDTFRAAASEQLTIWAQRAGVPIIKHQEGADAAAVVFDATASAKARKIDVLLVDTAGRLHTKSNLMEELRKMARVASKNIDGAPQETLLVLDATTGQNAVSQAKLFGDVVPLTGVVLTKLDGTAKGGVILSVKRELGVPVRWIGVGEGVDDLRPFDPVQFADALFDKNIAEREAAGD
ncbi:MULTISPECIES: signal recognition particle-docking protein FtsY [Megasphaera]|uniref:Signal recognition particle receptor FtsY n=1 Tax=Megasphaera vaginalis (ex Srinivasan et al. 2021) TaxID=1111454 RepID=U7URG7_9FIRM|nr:MULTISPECIES: signal recognition particle-docking protein FtsY [Megasphaera]ERT62032.1 signal recognition particle-docking protein FtsY [Megasphaera vaginalis (ex Srinivasan et al. 2021)]